jgi:hypothetical protein
VRRNRGRGGAPLGDEEAEVAISTADTRNRHAKPVEAAFVCERDRHGPKRRAGRQVDGHSGERRISSGNHPRPHR